MAAPSDFALHLRQQAPFRYVDAVRSLDVLGRAATVELLLHRASRHFGNGGNSLPGFLLVEVMAQACGALLRNITTGAEGGVLVGIETASLPDDIAYPARLLANTRMVFDATPFFFFDTEVILETSKDAPEKCLASAKLQIMSRRRLT